LDHGRLSLTSRALLSRLDEMEGALVLGGAERKAQAVVEC
jgi:hypothetical protein